MAAEHRPTEAVVDDEGRTQGGYSHVAKLLNKQFPKRRRPISRQLVHKWWIYRLDNEFPEAIKMIGSANGKGRPEFDYAAVVEWYKIKRQHLDERRCDRSHTNSVTPAPSVTAATGKNTLAA